MGTKEELKMHIEPSVIEELADKLYDNKQALIAEIVANAYDADATEIYIRWDDNQIVISDNGVGMTRDLVNNSFLVIGKKKEETERISNVYKRPSLGSKGIGKLASIALAGEVEITTWNNKDKITSFKLVSKDMYQTKGEYKPQEIKPIFSLAPTDTGTFISMTQLKDKTKITLKEMAKIVANVFSVIMKEKNLSIFLDEGMKNSYKKIVVDDIRIDNLDNIISFDEKINLKNIFALSEKDLKADLDYEDITFSETIENIIIKEEEKGSDSKLKELLNKEVSVINSSNLEFEIIPNKKLKISGWIGTIQSQKRRGEIIENDDEIIIPIAYDGNINIVVNGRIGQQNLKTSLQNLSSRFFTDYVVGELHVNFFDDPQYKGMARSDRQGYIQTDERFKYVHDIVGHLLNLLIRKKDEVKAKRKSGIKKQIIHKSTKIKEEAKSKLETMDLTKETKEQVNEIIDTAVSKDRGYKTDNVNKMVFISYRDNENDFANKVYEICLEINSHMAEKDKFELFFAGAPETSTYKLYEKLKNKLGNYELYENIFSFVVLSPYYTNNWYTDIEFGMIHQSSQTTSSYGFITRDKSIDKPIPRIKTDGNKEEGHRDFNDYDLLEWPANGESYSDVESVFEDMLKKINIYDKITKKELKAIIKRNLEF